MKPLILGSPLDCLPRQALGTGIEPVEMSYRRTQERDASIRAFDKLSPNSARAAIAALTPMPLPVVIGVGDADGAKRRDFQLFHRFGLRFFHMVIAQQMESSVNNKMRGVIGN